MKRAAARSANALTQAAQEGYACGNAGDCPYPPHGGAWVAWHIGRCLWATGRSQPQDVRRASGSTCWVGDMRYVLHGTDRIERLC